LAAPVAASGQKRRRDDPGSRLAWSW
jgi:hypothetical protein